MRKFSSYGPVDKDLHYYVPRQALIDRACTQLAGEKPEKGGHYITVWAPRQRGKSWAMREVMQRIRTGDEFETAILPLQSAKNARNLQDVWNILAQSLRDWFGRDFPSITDWECLRQLFTARNFAKPLILILDEFDALDEAYIDAFANEFRNMYIRRANETDKDSGEKSNLLHGLALIGVRSVLGIENISGSPFNVQRSIHIPNLTFEEVESMYHCYERESGQLVEQAVIERVFYETQGQPGLVSWFGELLTETYNEDIAQPITLTQFEYVYSLALNVLPNNNVLNVISKAKQEPYQEMVLEMFKTAAKIPFVYDDPYLNFLYLNGVIDWEQTSPTERYVKFPCPFVQKRLFNYFARTLFRHVGQLHPPFEDLSDTISEDSLNVKNLLHRYEGYLRKNRDWLLKDAPRRADLRVYEAVYHFNLYMYLFKFLQQHDGQVWPEFPTGNGQADLLIRYTGKVYGIEIKTFSTRHEYHKALGQAARYGHHLGLDEITLALFIESVDDANRARYEAVYKDEDTDVTVTPVFVATGS